MRKLYIVFSGDKYHAWTERIVRDAPRMGADQVLVYDDWWLWNRRPEFVEKNRWLFEHPCRKEGVPRGVCWFAWKPLIILDAFSRCQEGDLVLYTDADTYPIRDISVVYDVAVRDGGIMLFAASGLVHREWCKRDCFILMGQDEPKYWDSQAGVARFMVFRNDAASRAFLEEWLRWCCVPQCNTVDPSTLGPELEGFKEHRFEQAIMTNLAHKYGHHLYREACAYGNRHLREYGEDADLYPQLFEQVGDHSYGPVRGQGSMFRNVND